MNKELDLWVLDMQEQYKYEQYIKDRQAELNVRNMLRKVFNGARHEA